MKNDSPLLSSALLRGRAVRVSSAVLTLMLTAGTITTASGRATAGPDKFQLVYKAAAGQAKRTKSNAVLTFEAEGEKVNLEIKSTSRVTFTEVDKSGNITVEDKTESEEVYFNGEKAPDDEEDDKDKDETGTWTLKPNGVLVSYKDTQETPEGQTDTHLGARITTATTPIFPDKAVGQGDTWTHEYKADATLGTRDAKADFEVLGVEKVGGVECVKLRMNYSETGADAISGKGTFVIERESGDKVSMDYAVQGVPFGPDEGRVAAGGDLHEERTEGGPLLASGTAPIAKKDDAVKPGEKKDDKVAAAAPGTATEVKKPEPKKEKTIDEVVKDFEKVPGLLTLWRKKDVGRDTIYAEIPEETLGKLMLLQATASTGTAEQIVAGDPINDILFKFDKSGDDKILMVTPNIWYRAESPELARAVRRSFADGYLSSFRIEAKQADRKSLLIDVSDLFRGDIAQISAAFSGGSPLPGMMPGGGFGMDREKTFIQSIRNFPENLVVTTQYHFMRGGRAASGALADPRSAPIAVTYNLSLLPTDNGYIPRLADPRVGYFLTGFQSFDDDAKEDPLVKFIYRWDLRKKDPTAALSEPVKPIVFWIDNAIPTQYRDAVRDGLQVWNKAFEKIGFKDAIVVKQMPDTPDPNDPNTPSDTGDTRFNFVRWALSQEPPYYAIAHFRVSPLSGQILNASITVDAESVRAFKLERKSIVDPAAAFAKGAGEGTEALIGARLDGKGPLSEAARAQLIGGGARIGSRYISHDPRYCQFGGEAFRRQAWMGFAALSLLGPEDMLALDQAAGVTHSHETTASSAAAGRRNPLINEKEYAEQIVRETVSHEMGHILGLRHNFAGSTQFSLEQLGKPEVVRTHGTGASVMDYNPFNIAALRSPGVPFFSQTIGDYDYWAIEYGYKPLGPDIKKSADELYGLRQIAKKSGQPGHRYQSDEQVMVGFDPTVMQYDLSADPLAYWQRTIQVSRQLLANLDKRVPKSGESYWEFTQAYSELLGMYTSAAGVASRYIGGLNVSRTHKDDVGERPVLVPIDPAKQKQALGLLNQYLFAPDALTFPERYYSKLTTDPWGFSFPSDFPIREQLSAVQKKALDRLFSGVVLTRVANNEFKMSGDPKRSLTLPYLFHSVGDNVWSELGSKKNVTTLRRQLQRAYVDRMIDMALKPGGGVPEDARMLAWTELRTLKGRFAAAKANPKLDEYTRIHYADSYAKVDRTLGAQVTLGGASAPAGGNILQMLMGGKDNSDATPQQPSDN